jgi:hypothetical protein
MKQLQTIIRTNERVAVALGNPYTVQLGHIYVDLLNVYKVATRWMDPHHFSPLLLLAHHPCPPDPTLASPSRRRSPSLIS